MRRLLLKNFFSRAVTEPVEARRTPALEAAGAELQGAIARRLGRSLAIRQVDAGSCNGCELEIHALANAYYDIERFGVRFVASPRHADVLLVTGPVTLNMREALERTWAATPAPKWVIAAGDCAAGCGVFRDSPACVGAVARVVPVDLTIRGCPPPPADLLQGLLLLLDAGAPAR
jgi:Ni,Fe-hydrogenase III small subunit